jgi:hypothetical protein
VLVLLTAALAIMTLFLVFPPFWNDIALPALRMLFGFS